MYKGGIQVPFSSIGNGWCYVHSSNHRAICDSCEKVAKSYDDIYVASPPEVPHTQAIATVKQLNSHGEEHSGKILTCLGIANAPRNHVGIKCKGCNAQDFNGIRFKCVTCKDLDYCERCWRELVAAKSHNSHMFWMMQSHFLAAWTWEIPVASVKHVRLDSGKEKNKVFVVVSCYN
jgi:hypothetical protein